MDTNTTIEALVEENAKLRAQIDNLQAAPPAVTISDLIGPEAYERMVHLFPSFRASETPTKPTDAASEVLWSCIRMLSRNKRIIQHFEDTAKENYAQYSDIYGKYSRATDALAEYAMRAVEGDDA